MMFEFMLPDPGEGLEEAEIVRWLVAAGDEVKVNDLLLEIETAKSIVELPSPVSGMVQELLVEVGQTVPVGCPIIRIDDGSSSHDGESAGKVETTGPLAGNQTVVKEYEAASSLDANAPFLVGSGPIPDTVGMGGRRSRRRGANRAPGQPGTAGGGQAVLPATNQSQGEVDIDELGASTGDLQVESPKRGAPVITASGKVLAKPMVRRLARDLGIDLSKVKATGPQGSVSREDLEAAYIANRNRGGGDRTPIRGVRKATASNLVHSVATHVHVTEFNTIDVTRTKEFVTELAGRKEFCDLHVSPLLIHAKAICMALQRHPVLNASWDEQRAEIVHHRHVNLGIAAATPRGLMVPVIREAETMGLVDLCREMNRIIAIARQGKLQPHDCSSGTFSITNVGVFGVDTGTPIINGQESAILAMGAMKRRPWVVAGSGADERIEPRWVSTLALSFDHRLIDGEQGSQFLADVSLMLESPQYAMLF